jgi:hypothetical protein
MLQFQATILMPAELTLPMVKSIICPIAAIREP